MASAKNAAPVMKSVEAFAAAGGPVVGICNGFQILLEAGLLEGAMLRNRSLQYRCEHVHVRVERTDTPWTTLCQPGQVMRIPIAHGEGNYFAAPDVIYFDGFGGQRVYIVPSRQLVIVHTGPMRQDWDDAILPNMIIRALP